MPKPEARVLVFKEVRVELSREEVDHALRCWVDHQIAPNLVPKAKNFAAIRLEAIVTCDRDGENADLIGYRAIYEPADDPKVDEQSGGQDHG